MWCSSVIVGGSAGNWTFYVKLNDTVEQAEAGPEKASFFVDQRGNAKYKACRHSKCEGEFFRISEKSMSTYFKSPTSKLVTRRVETPLRDKRWSYWVELGGPIPELTLQYEWRVRNAVPNPYQHGMEDARYPGTRSWNQVVVWVDTVTKKAVLVANRTVHPKRGPGPWSIYNGSQLIDIEAERYNLSETLAFIAYDTCRNSDFDDLRGDHTISLIDQMHVTNMNQFEFLGDVNLVKQALDVVVKAVELKPASTLKELADLYLTATFGAKSTMSDYVDLASSIAIETERYKRASRYRDRKVHTRSNHKVSWIHGMSADLQLVTTAYLDNYEQGTMGLMRTLDSWGIYPDLSAVWEKVPFSFVVDWFVNVQKNLNRMDARAWREYYNVRACICSSKLSGTYDYQTVHPGSRVSGQAEVILYNRYVKYSLPTPVVDLDIGLPTGTHQWVTGAALVIQKSSR